MVVVWLWCRLELGLDVVDVTPATEDEGEVWLVVVELIADEADVCGSMFGEMGGADEEDDEAEDEADDSDEEPFVEDVVELTFLAVSAALFLTILLIEETDGRLSSSQIPSVCNWFLISHANMVGLAFL